MMHVKTNGGTCDTYCADRGSYCVKAQDNKRGKGCVRDMSHAEGCDMSWGDQLCVCAPPNPCEGFGGYNSICDEPDWAGGNCAMHVKTNQGTCDTYCANQGSYCVKAQDNKK